MKSLRRDAIYYKFMLPLGIDFSFLDSVVELLEREGVIQVLDSGRVHFLSRTKINAQVYPILKQWRKENE